eukprot:scaffold6503_cov99-Amphora_coffeaeformis.AAC.6
MKEKLDKGLDFADPSFLPVQSKHAVHIKRKSDVDLRRQIHVRLVRRYPQLNHIIDLVAVRCIVGILSEAQRDDIQQGPGVTRAWIFVTASENEFQMLGVVPRRAKNTERIAAMTRDNVINGTDHASN